MDTTHIGSRGFSKATLLVIGLVVLIVLAGAGWYWWTTTPQYALSQIKKAYETHDVDLALKYIDIDAVFDNLWADIQRKATEQTANSSDGWEAFGAIIGQSLLNGMKPTIKENIRTQLIDSIRTATTTTNISALASTYTITREGKDVIVSSEDNEFKLRLHKGDEGWRVVAIEGLSFEEPSTDQAISTN